MLLASAIPSIAAAADASDVWPEPPFEAWVTVAHANVRARPAPRAPEIGALRRGDVVTVTGCVPSCGARGAWALLGEDRAVRIALLSATPPPPGALAQGSAARFTYGRVRGGGVRIHAEPDPTSRRIGWRKGGHDLAFRPDPALLARGFLQRPSGGYVDSARIRALVPSPFSGRHGEEPVVFALRSTRLQRADGSRGVVAKQSTFAPLAIGPRWVQVEGGRLPRRDVRIAVARPRPAGVPAGARWVHVDLSEQVLTAYEGDRLVFSTLVSTGKPGHATTAGTFRVFEKTVHAAMHGRHGDPYFVDEVPFVLYFNDGMGLHGTFWHDRFGRRTSHGCVNLSIRDAEWLFDWAPPELPAGWHAVAPLAAGRPTLHVRVEHAPPPRLPPGPTS